MINANTGKLRYPDNYPVTLFYMTLVANPTLSKSASARLLKLCGNAKTIGHVPERQAKHLDSIRMVLAEGADPNVQNRIINGFTTPLNEATNSGQKETVGLLLEAGAQVLWGPERSLAAEILTDEDEVYNGQPLDALGVAMESLSWDLAHYEVGNRVAQRRLQQVCDIALMLLDAGADPYLVDPALGTTPIEGFFRYLNNDGLSKQAPRDFVIDLLERLIFMGPDVTERLRQVAQGQWKHLDHGWRSMHDFKILGDPFRLRARVALLESVLPSLSTAPKVRL